jgi:predicted nucleic acid-binding protein
MQRIIVSDTSCLILLDKIGHLGLLKSIFGKITVTKEISEEFNQDLPDFIEVQYPKDKNYQRILENSLDAGEASAIALALDYDDCLLIMDETKGRREAKSLGLKVTGTIGILIVAKEKGLIPSLKKVFDKIGKTNFRINQALLVEALKKSGE